MSPESPSPSVRNLPSGAGLVLLDTSSNCLWVYNDSARQIWEQVERGGSSDDIAADLAGQYGIPEDVARADVSAILGQWRSQGLVRANGARPPASQAAAPIVTDWKSQPEPRWGASFTVTIRSKVFALAIEPAQIAEFIRVAFQHLVTPQARPHVCMQVRLANDGERALIVDGTERTRMREDSQVMGAVDQVVLEHLYPGIEWLALMHGGGIARGGAGFAVPAACGSGKTTLIAYLIANKGFTYIADDLIALATDGRLVPWPMPLGPKEGSWKLLSEWYPYLLTAPNYRTQLGEARQILPPPDAWDTEPVPLRGFIFPRYVAGADAKLTRLTALEALQRLLGDRVWLGYPMTEQRVSAFLARLEDMPAYSLVHGNVAEAAHLLDDIA
jgi:hypothetical protein